MAGALAKAIGRRRGYARGGDVDPDQYDYATESAPADASLTPEQDNAPRGAMSQTTAGLGPRDKIALAQQAMANLQSQRQTRDILQAGGLGGSPLFNNGIQDPSTAPGATNLPLLAAAGAMLKPTHSGTFSEALGNAFDAAVPVTAQQRQLNETAQLRKAQIDETAAYRQGLLGVRGQHEDAYAAAAAARVNLYQAQADKATQAAQNGEKFKYVGNDPDTGRPVLQGDRGTMKLGDLEIGLTTNQQSQADNREARTNLSQQSLDLRKQAFDALVQQRGITNDRNAKNDLARQLGQMTDEQIRFISAGKDPMGLRPPPTPAQAGAGVNQLRKQSQQTLQPQASPVSALPMPATAADAIPGKVYNTARGPARWDGSKFIPVGQ